MTEPRYISMANLIPLVAATFAIVVSVCVMMGWCVDSSTLEGVWLGLPTMKFNAALALLLGGTSLLVARWQARTAGWICAAAMTLIALLTLC